jgi:DUF4097 and DUF4098 domain-containing protein YvlB
MNFVKQLQSTAIAIILLPTFLVAGEKVDETLDAQANGVVEIHNVRGDIRVNGWNKNSVQVKGELDDLAEKFTFESKGKVTYIKVELPRRNINRGDGSQLTIMVPAGSRVDFNGVSTDFDIEAVHGGIDLRSVSGDLTINNISEQIYVNSVSGDIKIHHSKGKAKLSTVSGDIKADMDSREVSLNSVSGDISVKLNNYDALIASSVNGELSVSGQQNDSGKSSLSSVNGDITLSFASAVNARVNVKSGPGGTIRNKLSSDPVEEVFPNQQKLMITVGDGSGYIKIGTVNGTITLKGDN